MSLTHPAHATQRAAAISLTALALWLALPATARAQRGLQVTPDQRRTLVNKDVGDARWAVTFHLDDSSITGNVFFTSGGDPVFLWCEFLSDNGATDLDDYEARFSCFAADDSCQLAPSPPDNWSFLSEVVVAGSFFLPSNVILTSQLAAQLTPALEDFRQRLVVAAAGAGADGPGDGGVAGTASGARDGRDAAANADAAGVDGAATGPAPRRVLVRPPATLQVGGETAIAAGRGGQITPDQLRVLISRDVGDERWAITLNLDDGTVTGNVFFESGGDPIFLWCAYLGDDGNPDAAAAELQLACSAADSCGSGPCTPDQWDFVTDVTLSGSFLLPPICPGAPIPGPGQNHRPTLASVFATRLVLSFGRDTSVRFANVATRPGIVDVLPLTAPPVISLDSNGDGQPDGGNAIVQAAAGIPSCCTLLVAAGASDPDGNAVVYNWLPPLIGTYYATGSASAGGLMPGQVITDLATYNRNSVFWEGPPIGFPVLDEFLMGGLTSRSARVRDVPASGAPLFSPTRFVSMEYDRAVHLELVPTGRRRLPGNDPAFPNGIGLQYFADVNGSFAAGLPIVFAVHCDSIFTIPGVTVFDTTDPTFECKYDEDEESNQVHVTAAGSTSEDGLNPYLFPLDGAFIDFFRSKGCEIGDTDVNTVRADGGGPEPTPMGTPAPCDTQTEAGGDAPFVGDFNLGATSGTFQFDFETFSIKDRIIVTYQGSTLFDTGCVGANGSQSLSYSGGSTIVRVQVIPNCDNPSGTGTAWNFTVSCPT